jgi:ERCC4-related helicase
VSKEMRTYWALMKIARQHGGAFLCDGVGLGKTFVGLQLIERLILHEGKRVVLFAPGRDWFAGAAECRVRLRARCRTQNRPGPAAL